MPSDLPQHTPSPSQSHVHAHEHTHDPLHRPPLKSKPTRSVLAWSAWLRVLAVLPAVAVLWLAVLWANEGVALW